MDDETICTRIRALLIGRTGKSKELARYLGIDESTVTGWKKGSYPSSKYVIGISQFLNVSIDWLLTGKEKDIPEKSSMKSTLSNDALDLAVIYDSLDKSKQRILIGDAEKMLDAMQQTVQIREDA